MTQNNQILKHLQTRKRGLTSWDAIQKYRITRLSARIQDLKDRGVKIGSLWEKSGNNKKYKRYYLQAG